ncbi:MAG: hypothetical protein FRX49_07029 [Trebouxia sp. A1-2]|nr:MAG: hypothetical protein FRX49_07029 [Trebouxia sp. A1-2]
MPPLQPAAAAADADAAAADAAAAAAAAAAVAASDADDTLFRHLGLNAGAVAASVDDARGLTDCRSRTEDCGDATAAELPGCAHMGLSHQTSEAATCHLQQHLD